VCLIFEIARLTANFLKFVRLGAHFEKNCATGISGAQYKLSILDAPYFSIQCTLMHPTLVFYSV
jgi:hypothetical protein